MKTREQLVAEARSIVDAAKKENRNLTAEEKTAYDAIMADVAQRDEMAKAEERVARLETEQRTVPAASKETREVVEGFAELRTAMTEKRGITVNGTGAVSVIGQIVKQISQKRPLISQFSTFYGPNSSTVIPILSPGLAVPAGQAEGATMTDDATAVLGATKLEPFGYISVLPVTAEAMLMSGAAIEAELPNIFADAFGKAMFAGALTGAGTGQIMSGMFLPASIGNKITCAAAGAPKLVDLIKLALSVQDYTDDAAIVMNPAHFASMLLETTAESAPIKQEILSNRTILGVPVILSGGAPSTTAEDDIVAVAMPMSNYALAIAQELDITPIRVKGDSKTYFQAQAWFNGKVILPANAWGLVGAAL